MYDKLNLLDHLAKKTMMVKENSGLKEYIDEKK